MIKALIYIFIGILALVGAASLGYFYAGGVSLGSGIPLPPLRKETDHKLVIKKIEALGRLEVLRYQFQDVVTHEEIIPWLPDPKVILIVSGEAIGCIDFSKMDSTDIRREPNLTRIFLPAPELCHVKIDHQKSRVYDTRYTILSTANLVDEAYKLAEREATQSVLSSGILSKTRQQALWMIPQLFNAITDDSLVFEIAEVPETPSLQPQVLPRKPEMGLPDLEPEQPQRPAVIRK